VPPASSVRAATKPIVVTVVGFPLGYATSESKAHEAAQALRDGAHDIDMVVRLAALRAGDMAAVRADIEAVARAVHQHDPAGELKVILETASLSEEQIIAGCRASAEGGADYVKTSTGFHPAGGASVEAVALMHRCAAPLKVKAAGGIRDAKTAWAMIDAGASRLGTSSGVALVEAE
jgi:deoxyribose-phosphate aldolase